MELHKGLVASDTEINEELLADSDSDNSTDINISENALASS